MKKVLLILGLVLSFIQVEAKSTYNLPKTNRYNQTSLQFVERGVEFVIFKNGEFDFNTHPMRGTRRSGYNTTYGVPRGSRYGHHNRGVRIEHDYYGRVRRIGNTFINYDSRGRVKRIGTVYVSYNRRGLVRQLGGLHIFYTRYGRIAYTSGRIKRPINMQWHDTEQDWNGDWGTEDEPYYNDEPYEDEDTYYFKQNPKGEKKHKKEKRS